MQPANAPAPVLPYGSAEGSGKKEQVGRMFNAIAPRYDLLNRLLTAGIDQSWRRRAVRLLAQHRPRVVLDLATGTADFALLLARMQPRPEKIMGMDIAENMLAVGRQKVKRQHLQALIELSAADAEALPLPDASVDGVTVGFGVRNFENLRQGLAEIRRVLRPGGAAIILEPGEPRHWPLRPLYRWYFHKLMPRLGALLSRNRVAYSYLPASVDAFPSGPDFVKICREVGFSHAQWQPLTFGICALYILKP